MDPLDTYKRHLSLKEIISGIAIVIVIAILFYLLWRMLNAYIAPEANNPTQKKDLVQAFAVIVGGLVAFGTLLIGWRNLRHNQRTLLVSQQNTQQTLTTAQEVESRRAQNDALQSYYEQMGNLLLDKDLRNSPEGSEVRILAQAQTHTVLPTLNADRKRSVLIFLYKSNLLDANKTGVGLIRADLGEANLSNTHLMRINLQGADLREANLQDANLQEADLQDALLQGAYLQDANLFGADLREANLQDALLFGADLRRANLREANLQGANLQDANLQGGANLQEADLEGALLGGANLQDANLQDALLFGADLRRANLREANLREANLQDANLEGANLFGADLRRARGVTTQQLERVMDGTQATMPNGQKYEDRLKDREGGKEDADSD